MDWICLRGDDGATSSTSLSSAPHLDPARLRLHDNNVVALVVRLDARGAHQHLLCPAEDVQGPPVPPAEAPGGEGGGIRKLVSAQHCVGLVGSEVGLAVRPHAHLARPGRRQLQPRADVTVNLLTGAGRAFGFPGNRLQAVLPVLKVL